MMRSTRRGFSAAILEDREVSAVPGASFRKHRLSHRAADATDRTRRERDSRRRAGRFAVVLGLALALGFGGFSRPALAQTDTTAPTFTSATVNSTSLVITFSENLAAAANLANAAFTVKKTPPMSTAQTVSLSGAPSISGATVTLTLAGAVVSSDTVTVAYTKPGSGSNNKLKDAADNEVATFAAQSVTNNTPAAVCPGDTAPANAIWSTCLTIGVYQPKPHQIHSHGMVGYHSWLDYGSLSSKKFTTGNKEYTAKIIDFWRSRFTVRLSPGPGSVAGGWVLRINGVALSFSDAKAWPGGGYRWTSPGFYWSSANDGDKISVSLSPSASNSAPTVANRIPDQTVTVGSALSYTFPENTFSDADGHTLSYRAVPAEGGILGEAGGALPRWLSFDASSRTFSGTPAEPREGPAHRIPLRVTAYDGHGGSVSDTFNIAVVNRTPNIKAGNRPPRLTSPYGLVWPIPAGRRFSHTVPSTRFRDPDGDALVYTAVRYTGKYDLHPLPSWLSFDGATRTFSGTPQRSDVGSHRIYVRADDGYFHSEGVEATRFEFEVYEALQPQMRGGPRGGPSVKSRSKGPSGGSFGRNAPSGGLGTLSFGLSSAEAPAGGCPVNVNVRFVDGDGTVVEVGSLTADDFTVENGRVGTPVADDEGSSWTVPAWSDPGFTGLMRVRLLAKEPPAEAEAELSDAELEAWNASELVFRVSGDDACAPVVRNELASLALGGLDLDPAFAGGTTSYAADAAADEDEVTVEAAAVYGSARVSIAPEDADAETDGHQVALAEGDTEITVTVTPEDEDGEARDYTVTVTRASAPVSDPDGTREGAIELDVSAAAEVPQFFRGYSLDRGQGDAVDYYRFVLTERRKLQLGVRDLSIDVVAFLEDAEGERVARSWTRPEDTSEEWLDPVLDAGTYYVRVEAMEAGTTEYYVRVGLAPDPSAPPPPPPPSVLTGFVLVDVSDRSTVATLTDGARIDLGSRSGGRFGIRAEVSSGAEIGSVVLRLSGSKAAWATENLVPYSLYGDRKDGSGGRLLNGRSLPAGSYTLGAAAYSERGASGTVLGTLSVSFRVLAPAALTVSDAEGEEGTDAALEFAVTLDRTASAAVTVDYATSDGTATAGDDYTATSGTLTFAAGETAKTVSVPILDDAHDEGSETLTLTLSNASGATLADATATGTITNSDPIPEAWLARFGRTVTGQVLDAVQARLSAPRAAGAQAHLAGQALPFGTGAAAHPGPEAGAGENAAALRAEEEEDRAALAAMTSWLSQTGADGRGTTGFGAHGDPGLGAGAGGGPGFRTRALTGRDFVLGTSFTLTGGGRDGAGFASVWGRGAIAGFDGREGDLSVDGEVTSGLLGADWASERWKAGLALGHSRGSGGYRTGGTCDVHCAGDIEAVLTGLYPYGGMDLTERVSLWAAAGYGSGEVTVTPEGGAGMTADLSMSMGAAGLRSEVLKPEGGEGLALALKADTRITRTSSDAVRSDTGNLEAADADVWLVRAGIEGSRRFALGSEDGAGVTPTFELGIRHDGGDAETGLGADLGGGITFADAKRGLTFESRARALVAHEADGFREWGAAVSFGFDPSPDSGRGLSMSLIQSWGASPSGGMDALLSRETLAGLAANDDDGGGRFEAASRLQGEVGYGLPAFGGGFTGTPNVGFGLSEGSRDWRIGWRLSPERQGVPGFELNLDATRTEPANDDTRPEHGLMLRGRLRW